MWYFKQTAKSLWNASKGLVKDNRTKIQKLLDQISQSQQQIISTSKLNQLATVTFQIQQFQQTFQQILKRIKTFQYDLQQSKKTLNILIATNYIIKHGATAFVDQLRNYQNVFIKYQQLKDIKTYQDQILQKQLTYQLDKIRSRARHIELLLTDKKKLLKEKQLSMLIRQKMKLYQKSQTNQSKQSYNNDNRQQRLQKQRNKSKNVQNIQTIQQPNYQSNSKQAHQFNNKSINSKANYGDKLDGFLQKYMWKYVDKFDQKMQVISDKILQKYDKYIAGELPANFQPQQFEDQTQDTDGPPSDKKMKRQSPQNQFQPNAQYQSLQDDDQLMRKLQQEGQKNIGQNLIDFEQVDQQEMTGKHEQQKQESLI